MGNSLTKRVEAATREIAGNEGNRNALCTAAANGDLMGVRSMLKLERNAPHVTDVNSEGFTALQLAAMKGHLEVVRFLVVEAGANPNQRGQPRRRSSEGGVPAVITTTQAGGEVVSNCMMTPFALARLGGFVHIMNLLQVCGAIPD